MENQNHHTINVLAKVIVVVVLFAAFMFVLGVGIWIGEEHARFSFRWAQNYHKNFGGSSEVLIGDSLNKDMTNSYGVFGSIIAMDFKTIIVRGQDNIEKTVIVFDDTTIRNAMGIVPFSKLQIGDSVVVIGSPGTQGQIDAKFIRVLPPVSLLHRALLCSRLTPGVEG